MKIIMLLGKSSCGKTTTLNKVYDFINPTEENIIKAKSKLGGDKHDFECIVKYKDKTIAFFTMGDYSCYLIEAFEKYDKKHCDFLICACNNRFKRPYERIKKYSHSIINKTISDSQRQIELDIANNNDKEQIIRKLEP